MRTGVESIQERGHRASLQLFRGFLLFTFAHAAIEKWKGGVPEWFRDQFGPTFLAAIPGGLGGAYFGLAAAEAGAALVLASAILANFPENPTRRGAALSSLAFLGAEACFAALGFGQRISHRYAEAATLFACLALTVLVHLGSGRSRSDGLP